MKKREVEKQAVSRLCPWFTMVYRGYRATNRTALHLTRVQLISAKRECTSNQIRNLRDINIEESFINIASGKITFTFASSILLF